MMTAQEMTLNVMECLLSQVLEHASNICSPVHLRLGCFPNLESNLVL